MLELVKKSTMFKNIIKFYKIPKFMIGSKKSIINHNFIVEIIVAYGIWKIYSKLSLLFEELLKNVFNGLTIYDDIFVIISESILCIFPIVYCVYLEKRPITSMGLVKINISKEVIFGFILGALFPCMNILPLMISGATIKLVSVNIVMIILYLIFYILQASGEELFFRGYLMVSLTKKYSLLFATIISSLFFALMHTGVINQIDQFITGLIFCIYIIKRQNIYGACVLHGINNFFLVNVFGSTGSPNVYSIFKLNFDNYLGNPLFDFPYYIHLLRILFLLIVIFVVPNNSEIKGSEDLI